MYISAARFKKDQVVVWERHPGKKRQAVYYPAPYYFYVENPDGQFKSIYGDRLERFDFTDRDEMQAARSAILRDVTTSNLNIYESDISPELKILSQHYHEAEIPKLNTTFLDIEVDYDPEIGFSSTANPYAPINAIALYHEWQQEVVVFVVPPKGYPAIVMDDFMAEMDKIAPLPKHPIILKFFKNERELLFALIDEIQDSDVLSGWNSNFFDLPYIAKRIIATLGERYVKKLNFDEQGRVWFKDVEVFGNKQIACELTGRVHLDYLDLFKKYEMGMRPSYKLEAIADEILPHLPKITYDGTLADLYKKNFVHFVRYNIRDTEILGGLEEKLGYVALANVMCHTSTAQFKDVLGTIRLTDLAIVNYCHYTLDVKVPDWTEKPDGSIQGAYVLMPQIGMHKWLASVDINSLYPSSIRSINISPEMLIGQFEEKMKAQAEIQKRSDVPLTLVYDGSNEVDVRTGSEWNDFLREKKWAVSGYGTVFDQNQQGILPTILANWFKQRKVYQKQKNEFYEKAQAIKDKYKKD